MSFRIIGKAVCTYVVLYVGSGVDDGFVLNETADGAADC